MKSDTRITMPTSLPSARNTWKLLTGLLDADDRRRLRKVLMLIIASAMFETVSVGSIFPFLNAVANPGGPTESGSASWLYEFLGCTNRKEFVMALGCGTLILLVLGNALVALSQWRLYWFANQLTRRLSGRLLAAYLRAPYVFHLPRSAPELARGVLNETDVVIQGVVLPVLFTISRMLVVTLLVVMLLLLEPVVAIIAMTILGGAYAGILALTRRRIQGAGDLRNQASERRFQVASESLSAIREVKIYECEGAFVDRFDEASNRLAKANAAQQAIANLPKYAVEVLAFGSVVLLAVILIAAGRSGGSGVALLGLFAFAGYRLAPALQLCFSSVTNIRYSLPALERFDRDLRTIPVDVTSARGEVELSCPRSEISLRNVSFAYPGRQEPVFCGLTVSIPVGSSVAIVGPTGCGKSTLLDLLFGLLRPREGHVEVDGRPLTDTDVRCLRQHVAYVSQHSVFIDASIRENIAFGQDRAEIDDVRVRECAQLACLADYVERDLPEQYETRVGDRAGNMSGGQRQRLSIARALYSQRPVLVLDEATSALDAETESLVLENLLRCRRNLTVVLVTHKPSVAARAAHVYDMRAFLVGAAAAKCDAAPAADA